MFNKQSIKQFLKPNKKKILVFAVLGISALFFLRVPCQITHVDDVIINESSGIRSENALCCPLRCMLDSNIGLIFSPRYGCSLAVCPWSLIASKYILFYILSCFVIFAYDRTKPKKS